LVDVHVDVVVGMTILTGESAVVLLPLLMLTPTLAIGTLRDSVGQIPHWLFLTSDDEAHARFDHRMKTAGRLLHRIPTMKQNR
jgi:hypothetical protein